MCRTSGIANYQMESFQSNNPSVKHNKQRKNIKPLME